MPLIQGLINNGIRVYSEPTPANVSIVIDGKNENPLAFNGKRVLAYWADVWKDKDYFNELYKPILEEYYDDMIDLTNLTFEEVKEALINYEA